MAVRVDNANYLTRAGLGDAVNLTSQCIFVRVESRSSPSTDVVYRTSNGAYSNQIRLMMSSTGGFWRVMDGSDYDAPALTMSVGTWYFFGIAVNGTTATYVHGAVGGSLSNGTFSPTDPGSIAMNGNDFAGAGAANITVDLHGVRVWNAALSVADLEAEAASLTPVRTSGLRSDSLRGADLSAHLADPEAANDWSTTGTVTAVAGPTLGGATWFARDRKRTHLSPWLRR
jgi:hypothetical protein